MLWVILLIAKNSFQKILNSSSNNLLCVSSSKFVPMHFMDSGRISFQSHINKYREVLPTLFVVGESEYFFPFKLIVFNGFLNVNQIRSQFQRVLKVMEWNTNCKFLNCAKNDELSPIIKTMNFIQRLPRWFYCTIFRGQLFFI